MKKYILQGNERSVAKIVRENRIRVERGEVEFIPFDEETTDEGFVDDDVNGFKDVDGTDDAETTPIEDEFFNEESEQPSDAVRKILLEPLGKVNTSEESTNATDIVEATVAEAPMADSKEVCMSDGTEAMEDDSKNTVVEDVKDIVPEDKKESGTMKKKKRRKSKSE